MNPSSCAWCHEPFISRKPHARFCRQSCRQSAFRLRRRSPAGRVVARSHDDGFAPFLRFAYADPPYPGTARRFYKHEPTFAGEVDQAELVRRLCSGEYDGWALSTSARALRDILPLVPDAARVCAWVKPHRVPPATYGLHNAWEPVIVLQGRRLRPGRPDRLIALPARGGGTLPGRKPIAFCAWLFDALGMMPGDTLDDLFPGTGIVSRAWAEIANGKISHESRWSSPATTTGRGDGRAEAEETKGDELPSPLPVYRAKLTSALG